MKKFLFVVVILFSITNTFAQKTKLHIQTGHPDAIGSVATSPNGRYMITRGSSTILWDVLKKTELRVLPATVAAAFSVDGQNIITISVDGYKITTDLSGKTIQKSSQKISSFIYEGGELFAGNNILWQNDVITNLTTNISKKFKLTESWQRLERTGYSANLNMIALASTFNIELFNTITGGKVNSIDIKNIAGTGIHTVDFSADGKSILYGDETQIIVFDIASGKAKTTISRDYPANSFYRAKLSPDQQSIIAITKQKIFKYSSTGEMVWASTFPKTYVYNPLLYYAADGSKIIYFSEKDHYFVNAQSGNITTGWGERLNQYGTEKLIIKDETLFTRGLSPEKNAAIAWDFPSGSMKTLPDYIEKYGSKISIDTTNKITYFKKSENVVGYDEKENKIVEVNLQSDGNYAYEIADNGKFMLVNSKEPSGENKINLLRLPQGTSVNKVKGLTFASTFAKANNWVAAVTNVSHNNISIYEIFTGNVVAQKKVVSFDDGVNGLQFSPNDNFIAYKVRGYNITVQTVKGNFQAVIPNSEIESGSEFIFTKDEKYLLFIAQNAKGLKFYDLQKKIFVKELAIECSIFAGFEMTLSDNGRFLFVGTIEKNIQVFDLLKNKWVATLYSFVDTGDWAVLTQDGRFDATPGAAKQLYFVKGLVTYPLETLYENCFTPKLLIRILAGESFPIVNYNIDDLRPKPGIKMKYEQKTRNLAVADDSPLYLNTTGLAEITINATAPEDKVDEIRLFHNGKVVNLATRGLFVTDNDGGDSKKYTINLLPGNNTFRAIALNSQRTESDADEIVVSYTATNGNQPTPKPAPNNSTIATISPVDKNATMYLMVVGINAYTNKINPLAYALPDATAFKEELEKDAKSVLANVRTYFITDAKADKAGIVNAFNEIKKDAKPQDVFVFYYAGHGYINPANKEFYLVSADVTDGGESLLKNGIPAKDLQQYAVDIKAQQQLFILDACQSAGAFDAMLKHDGEQQKSLAVVARSTGTHWMAASGSTETAKEFGELGHGAFTYVLLQALKGQAATNKMITVNGMKNFLQIQVPELVKKYGSNNQYPASYGFGNDFPVEIVK